MLFTSAADTVPASNGSATSAAATVKARLSMFAPFCLAGSPGREPRLCNGA